MATLELTDEEVQTLKAVWEYALADDDLFDNIAEALGIENEDRGLTEDGEEGENYDIEKDPAIKYVNELSPKIMDL